jgi:LAO/AO transport system kinase
MSPDDRIERARQGDRRALARLVTLVEDGERGGDAVLASLYPAGGNARITGITGAPGAGKSTLVDHLIDRARVSGEVAVVAVDPSSPFTGGAILGDRVRMQRHSDDPHVYIRSLANRGHLGGLSATTPRVVALLDGIGFPEILVETVGVGQAEVEVASAADTVVVVVNPRWGDSVQAAKAGLLEIGDIFVVNKADRAGADETAAELLRMLEIGPPRAWRPPVLRTVATTGEGVDAVWDAVVEHRRHLESSGDLARRRTLRATNEVEAAVRERLRARFAGEAVAESELVVRVLARDLDPWTAAELVLADPSTR